VKRVSHSARARDDLLDIWLYLAEHGSETVANKAYDRIQAACARLAEHPPMGPARPDIHPDARALVIDRWLALYRATDFGAQVVRVVDGARDLSAISWDME
jgi:toxin ParE1/3/4